MPAQGPIFVTGATGAQGGAAVDALLDAGFAVRALVRDPGGAAAQALAARGVELVPGDFDDEASLGQGVQGASGVFSVQLPPLPGDLDSELRTGRKLIEAARRAGVDTFVHTSVARAGDQESFVGWNEGRWWPGYWTSKSGVNDMVRAAGFTHWVILKPAFMMENYLPPKAAWMFPLLSQGAVNTAMAPGARLDLIAASDVGRVAAAAFADPAAFHGKDIDLAADSLDTDDIAAIIARTTGKAVAAQHMTPADAVAAGNHAGLVESQQWATLEGYQVDIARTQAHGVALERFADWAARHRADFVVGD